MKKQLMLLLMIGLTMLACEENNSSEGSQTITPTEETTTKSTEETAKGPNWVCIPGKQVGAITPRTTEKDLVELFGADQVQREQLSVAEGMIVEGTIVFPESPNQLIIEWLPGQLYQQPAIVRIEGEGAEWKTAQGIGIGTKLDQLILLNEQPISFFGFDWDYSGLVSGWNEGKVDSNLVVFFAPGKPEAVYPDLLGDQTFSSDHPKAQAAELYVSSMMISLNEESNAE